MHGVLLPLVSRVRLCVSVCGCRVSNELLRTLKCLTVRSPAPLRTPPPPASPPTVERWSWISTTMSEPTKAQTAEVFKRLRHHAANKVRNDAFVSVCRVTFPSINFLAHTRAHTHSLRYRHTRMNACISLIRCASTANRVIQRGHRSRTGSICACSAQASTATSVSISRLSVRQMSVSSSPYSRPCPARACLPLSRLGASRGLMFTHFLSA